MALVVTAMQRIDASLFRKILVGGSAIPEVRPPNSVATYGMTETGSGIVDLLLDINRERGTTLVIVTHDVDLARKANRIVTLQAGRIQKIEPVTPT